MPTVRFIREKGPKVFVWISDSGYDSYLIGNLIRVYKPHVRMKMKKAIFLAVALLAGCGVDPKQQLAASSDPNQDAADYVGSEANKTREYFSDRNVSGEDAANGLSDAGDYVGSEANKTREYLSDRGFSSEHVGEDYTDGRDYVGREANVTRKYLYDRGLCNTRHGDQCDAGSNYVASPTLSKQ